MNVTVLFQSSEDEISSPEVVTAEPLNSAQCQVQSPEVLNHVQSPEVVSLKMSQISLSIQLYPLQSPGGEKARAEVVTQEPKSMADSKNKGKSTHIL